MPSRCPWPMCATNIPCARPSILVPLPSGLGFPHRLRIQNFFQTCRNTRSFGTGPWSAPKLVRVRGRLWVQRPVFARAGSRRLSGSGRVRVWARGEVVQSSPPPARLGSPPEILQAQSAYIPNQPVMPFTIQSHVPTHSAIPSSILHSCPCFRLL